MTSLNKEEELKNAAPEQGGKPKRPPMSTSTVNKIIAIVLALALWSYVVFEVNPTKTETIRNVPVTLTSVDSLVAQGLAVTGDTNYTVDVVLEGRRADVSNVSVNDLAAMANLVECGGRGQYNVDVSVALKGNFGTVEIKEIKPSKILVNVDRLVNEEKDIKVNITGSVPSEREVSQLKISPTTIQVGGAKSEVDSVKYLQASLDVSQLSERENTFTLEVEPVDASGMIVDNVVLSAAEVEVTAKLLQIKEVPLKVVLEGEPAAGFKVGEVSAPDSVWIKGSGAEIEGIKKVETTPVNIDGIKSDTTVPLTVKDVEVSDRSKNLSAIITLKKVASKEITYTSEEIQIENLPDGLAAAIQTPQITVTVSGDEADVRAVRKEDIKLYLSLKDATTDTVSAKLELRYALTIAGAAADPSEVAVVITQNQ